MKKKLIKSKKIDIDDEIEEVVKKKPKKKKKNRKFNFFGFLLGCTLLLGIVGITLVLGIGLYIIVTSPDFEKELLYQKESSIIYDINGDVMARTGENNITLISYEELPEVLVDALVATEDSRFFQHSGFDAARFLVASVKQVLGNSDAGGASTLSMQVIKNTYTSTVDTGIQGVLRKLTDIYMSIFKLENSYTKEEIVEFYVNSQWLGNDGNAYYTGITGVEQGSQYLFGKSVTDLSLAEASLLAGMFQAPAAYNPYNNPENARARQKIVLTLMVRHEYITQEQMDDALEIPIQSLLANQNDSDSFYLAATVDYAIAEVQDLTGLNPYTTPMEIYTTIDPDAQMELHKLETSESYKIPDSFGNLQFGIAITDTQNGSIVAMSPGIGYNAKSWNRAIEQRQPGSTAKPIVAYGPYIEHLNASPATYILDEEYTYLGGGSINNWDNQYRGIITLRSALATSRNIPALKAFHAVQAIDQTLIEDFVHALGIDYGEHIYESASIGGFDGISPLQLSAAYATFGRGGYYIEPYSVTKIVLLDSAEVIENKYTKEKAMSAETAYLINSILVTAGNSNVAGFTISGTELAGKTGTTTIDAEARDALGLPSNAIMDSWIASYTAEYSIATWLGYDTLSSDHYMTMNSISSVKSTISKTIGTSLYSKNIKFTKPSGIVTVTVEKDTFPLQLPSANTPADMKASDYFIKGTEPTEVSTRYASLDNPTSVTSSLQYSSVTINWNEIKTPDAISPEYLTNYFNTYFGTSATAYYNTRVSYNNSTFGALTYDVYKVENGTTTLIGSSTSNTLTVPLATVQNASKIIVKSSYSKYASCDSSGASINIDYSNVVGTEEDTNDNTEDDSNNNSGNTTTTPTIPTPPTS